MDKDTRNAIDRATQKARRILENDLTEQLEGTYDVRLSGVVTPAGGPHLTPRQHTLRERIVASIDHRRAAGMKPAEAVGSYLRDAAFTAVNRFAALKMIEARGLAQECVSKGEQSNGYREFTGLAPGIALLPGGDGYRLYLECLFDELSTEVKVLFDRRDPASALWPRRTAFEELLSVLNAPELASVWAEDETIGWVYQYFNSGDERRAMREASQAPRNSRELAVRNQFFTPRYVVRFLTENTLARIWIEMMGEGGTRIAERCDFLVRDSESRGPRAKKDPRDIKLLDPACGSGHFLLYAFDLFLVIYEEAWADLGAARRVSTGRTLRDDYPDIDALRRAVPALILEHNLHGVDIDPRCAQIAALALWLRAQRAWKALGIQAGQRPRITRTHIVVAEPMPGDAALVEEFAATLHPPLLGDLFKKMVSEMRLAGELGTLLQVERTLGEAIGKAREDYVRQRRDNPLGLDLDRLPAERDLGEINDETFFDRAEELLLAALRKFAESAAGGAGVRRRLFAGDAAQGMALVDIVQAKYDVVLMNPPFGACGMGAKKEFEKAFPRTKNDLYAAFVERGVEMLHKRGMLGAITSRTGFFLSSFQKWREEVLLKEAPPVVFADLGYGVLDAAIVEVAAYCLEKYRIVDNIGAFFRIPPAVDKAQALQVAISSTDWPPGLERFDVASASFNALPRSPFAYWVTDRLRKVFSAFPPFEIAGRTAKQGLATTDDLRFVRFWWEVDCVGIGARWFSFAKGGKYSPYYADIHLCVDWLSDGAQSWAIYESRHDVVGGIVKNPGFYFRPGLTWPVRAVGFSPQPVPANCIFSARGYLATSECKDDLLQMLGLMASEAFEAIFRVGLSGERPEFVIGVLLQLPVPPILPLEAGPLAALSRRAWSLKRSLDTRTENSHAFNLPALLQSPIGTLTARAAAWADRVYATETQLAAIQAEIDDRCFDLYGINDEDRKAITEGFGGPSPAGLGEEESVENAPGSLSPSFVKRGPGGVRALTETDITPVDAPSETAESSLSAAGIKRPLTPSSTEEGEQGDDESESAAADTAALTAELVSWSVGVAFGRFDVRLATGERPLPPEPEPFDPLPICSPGMLTGDDGLPLAAPPPGYQIAFPRDGVLLDDPGHPRDLFSAARAVFDVVFGNDADARWQEAAEILDPKNHDLRAFLARTFFEQHIKRYSKSRRKAPIYWQLATPSASYSIWLYAHRLTPDTFFHLLNEVITPKLEHEERKLLSIVQEHGPNPTASQRKVSTAQEALVEELRAFRDEIARVAPLWKPDLDDGVLLTMAPLLRLVPQHRAWQKELKTAWDSLCAGDYDWAHVAMHLWPERVVPKCATDRSLAIAHGLEEVFWEEGVNGKWAARKTPMTPIPELVASRTSPAVKAALSELLEAPVTGGATKAGRRGRTSVRGSDTG